MKGWREVEGGIYGGKGEDCNYVIWIRLRLCGNRSGKGIFARFLVELRGVVWEFLYSGV